MNIMIKTRKANYYSANLKWLFLPIAVLVAAAILAGVIYGYQNYYEKIYDEAYRAIRSGQRSIVVTDNQTALNAVRTCAYATPELFTVDTIQYTTGDKTREYYFFYNNYGADYESNLARYQAYIDEIMADCPALTKDEDKVKWIHDTIATRYDYDANRNNHSVLSMLDSGKGVCSAYTALFIELAGRLGLSCGVAVSDRMDHTWNIVKVGRTWYHVDVTWDDQNTITYDYYLKTDAEFRELDHHDWVDTSKSLSYYDNLKIKLLLFGGIALAVALLITFAPMLFHYLFR